MSHDNVTSLQRRVQHRLESLIPGAAVGDLQVLPGGHSGLTYRIDVGDTAAVIKAVPPGRPAVGRHDMLRQAQILGALTDTDVPVPALITVDDQQPAWFAMSWAEGEAVEPVLDGKRLPAGQAHARALRSADVLAALHRVDPARLADGAPQAASLPDELDKWTAVLHAGPAEFITKGAALSDALRASIPEPIRPTIVHGDYRLGNILFAGDMPQAVVDWEIWGLGDPRGDLGYFAVFVDHRNFPELGCHVAELPSEAELAEAYYEAGGQSIDDIGWFQAFGRFKMAAIMSHNLRRHREGRHHDPAQETLPPTIRALTETGLAAAHLPRSPRGF
jgi:aminoglycoside phosphotransferase (APT) family kinase protein